MNSSIMFAAAHSVMKMKGSGLGSGSIRKDREPEDKPLSGRWIIGHLLVVFLFMPMMYFGIYRIMQGLDSSDLYCGMIVHKYEHDTHNGKTGTYSGTERKFIVNFDIAGTREVDVGLVTYLDRNVGDRVCFNIKKVEISKEYWKQTLVFAFLILYVIVHYLYAGGAVTAVYNYLREKKEKKQ